MTSGESTPAWSPLASPIPPSPSPAESECKGAPARQFAGLGDETLRTVNVPISRDRSRAILQSLRESEGYLPGQPRIRLSPQRRDADDGTDGVLQYLQDYHLTNKLDELLPFMKFIFVSFTPPLVLSTWFYSLVRQNAIG